MKSHLPGRPHHQILEVISEKDWPWNDQQYTTPLAGVNFLLFMDSDLWMLHQKFKNEADKQNLI
jgi:hypothetical protein